jgi:hypothetical protein
MARREISVETRRFGAPVDAPPSVAGGPRSKDQATSLDFAGDLIGLALSDEAILRDLIGALQSERAAVAEHAANVLKKIQAQSPRVLDPYAGDLIRMALTCRALKARWNLWQVLGRTELTPRQRAVVVDRLYEAMGSASAFERVHAMQALADLSQHGPTLENRVRRLIEVALQDTSAAVRARARLLLKRRPTGEVAAGKPGVEQGRRSGRVPGGDA